MGIEVGFQTAVYGILSSSSIGAVGIFDVAPQNADGGDASLFPYVVIGRAIFSQADTQTTIGHSVQARIHTFSRSGSLKECKLIQGAIFAALHKQPLSIAGFNNFSLLREDSDCTWQGSGQAHGVCEYRALIEAA